MKTVRKTSLQLGVAVFLALLVPGNAFATTGAASSSSNSFTMSIESTGGGTATISETGSTIRNTGPNSVNRISSDVDNNVEVDNTNDVVVDNTTTQTAVSGDAVVTGNTTAGSAVTGDAANVNRTELGVVLNNETGIGCGCEAQTPGNGGVGGGTGGNGGTGGGTVVPVVPVAPVGGQGGARVGGEVLGVSTVVAETQTQPVGGRGGQVLGVATPAQLPVTGAESNLSFLLAALASALTYTVVLRRQRLQQTNGLTE